jgi:hypothetical protein
VVTADLGLELVGGAGRDHPAVVDDHDLVGESVGLLELTQLSLRHYTAESTGPLVPLLHIVPSKTDAERLIPMSLALVNGRPTSTLDRLPSLPPHKAHCAAHHECRHITHR